VLVLAARRDDHHAFSVSDDAVTIAVAEPFQR
jgi:hypothetical protein